MKGLSRFLLLAALLTSPALATVTVTAPVSGQTLNSPISFMATATTSTCSSGVASMGIYVDYVRVYVVKGARLNTAISIAPGPHHTVVEEWDYCGGATLTAVDVTITGVAVKSPIPRSTVTSPVTYSATAATTCSKGVAAMGIYVNNVLVYTVSGSKLNTQLSLAPGPEHTVVEEWDYCRGAAFTTDDITVSNTSVPTVSVSASPSSITLGSSSTLKVTATNATAVWITASDGASYTLSSTGGSVTVKPTASTTYWVTARNGAGKGSAVTAVTVMPSAPVDYPRYKGDVAGTGANTSEVLLAPTNLNSLHFGEIWGFQVDSFMTTQPLYMHGLTINGATHNVVFVATSNDSLYAVDANTGKQLWKRSFLSSGVTAVNLSNVGVETMGILSTPVIDPGTRTMYLVVWTAENNDSYFPHRLHAIDITTGLDKATAVTITDSAMQPLYQLQRPALLLVNGTIYAAFGSVGDITPYHGLVFAFDEATLVHKAKWNVTAGGMGGGIWMSGAAPTADSAGNVYLSIGNGHFDGSTNFGESAVKLSPSLTVLDYFTPYNYNSLNTNDVDLGSGSVVVAPDQPGAYKHELIVCGKPTPIYVLNRDNMGKLGTSADNVIQRLDNAIGGTGNVPDSGQPCYNSPAVWNNNVYFAANDDVLKMFTISPTTGQLSLFSNSATAYAWPGADPVVSSSGTTNGIVWTVDSGTATLHANDAKDVSKSLYVGPSMGSVHRWVPPTVVNGWVYVAASNWLVGYSNK